MAHAGTMTADELTSGAACTRCGPRWRPGWAEHAAYADARGAARHRADAAS